MPNNVTFKWSNYTKPTPRNVKMFMEFWKGLIVLITTSNIYNDANKFVTITILILGYVIDRAAKLAAIAEADEARSSITVEFPTEMKEKVTVTENNREDPEV